VRYFNIPALLDIHGDQTFLYIFVIFGTMRLVFKINSHFIPRQYLISKLLILYSSSNDYGGTKVTCMCFYLCRGHEILCRGHELLSRGHEIAKSWPRVTMSWPRVT
jgi:hypothetical protein